MIELVTKRLAIRMGAPEDASEVADFFAENRAHFAPWDPHRDASFFTAEFWRERLIVDARAANEDRAYRFFVFESERVIGHAHFSNLVRGAFQCCHLGFGIAAHREGRGLMREALERAIAWAFDEASLHRIEANHRPENVRSGALLRRLGFVPQGYARDYLHIDGQWRDHVLTALLNERWKAP